LAEGSYWQILLQKSFLGDERNFLGPLMRLVCGDVRDLIVWHKTDHGPAHRRYRALQQWRSLKICFREIFGIVRFSTFATISALLRHPAMSVLWLLSGGGPLRHARPGATARPVRPMGGATAPLDERGRRRAANRAEWFNRVDKPLVAGIRQLAELRCLLTPRRIVLRPARRIFCQFNGRVQWQ